MDDKKKGKNLAEKMAILSLITKNEEDAANRLITKIEVTDVDIKVEEMLNELND